MSLFEHIHIKSHTGGSSNEISFDVLRKASDQTDSPSKTVGISGLKGKGGSINLSKMDAASEAAAQAYEKGKGRGKGKAGKHNLGSPFVASSDGQSFVLSRSPEVARRKKARRGYRLFTSVLGGLVIILLLCTGIFLNDRINQDRMSFKTRLTNLTMQLANIDKDLALIDQLTVNPLFTSDYEQMNNYLHEMPGIMSSIVSVQDQAEEIRATQPAGYNAEALNDLIGAADARTKLLSSAARLFELGVQAGSFIQQADEIWDLVVQSTKTASDAAWQANQATTAEAIQEDNNALQGAIGDLTNALRQLEFMKTNLEGLDLTPYIDYAAKKKQALQYATETNEALLQMDRELAQEANDKYNAAEKEAVELTNDITQSLSDAVRGFYRDRIEAAQSNYEETREAVIEADSALRRRIS